MAIALAGDGGARGTPPDGAVSGVCFGPNYELVYFENVGQKQTYGYAHNRMGTHITVCFHNFL